MPFKSQAQSNAAFGGYLGPEMKSKAKEWADKTDYKHLPDKVSEEEKISSHKPGCSYLTAKGCDCGRQAELDTAPHWSKKYTKESTMQLTKQLLEAIRKKDWHTANVLFERTMRERMIARVNDIKTRVFMEDKEKCELCGSNKNISMVDGTPLCAKCDPESDLDEGTEFMNGQKDADVAEAEDMNTDCPDCDKPMNECSCK